nr:hypothetical protein Iba_chr03dCG9360 [Ipomoea batatas]
MRGPNSKLKRRFQNQHRYTTDFLCRKTPEHFRLIGASLEMLPMLELDLQPRTMPVCFAGLDKDSETFIGFPKPKTTAHSKPLSNGCHQGGTKGPGNMIVGLLLRLLARIFNHVGRFRKLVVHEAVDFQISDGLGYAPFSVLIAFAVLCLVPTLCLSLSAVEVDGYQRNISFKA